MKKNAILVDYNQDRNWDFIKGLEISTRTKWDIECSESSGLHGGIKNIIRYFSYFIMPLHIFRHRKEYERVIAWQQFYGLIFSFYCKLFRADCKKCPEVYVMEFIYKPKRKLLGRIYERFIRYCVNSQYITTLFVFSKDEEKQCKAKFEINNVKAVHYGLEDSYEKYKDSIKDEGFFLAAGRSNRDYDFLIKEWPQDKKLKIVCDSQKLKVNNNIEQLFKCYRDQYYTELAKCHAVIIPLKDRNASSGQLVMLQAMMLGKPIIITENNTVRDYLKDNEEGYIINPSGTELRKAIKKLDDEIIWKRISSKGRNSFLDLHSMKALGIAVGTVIVRE